jgi:predicted hydrocarbon binding protein
MEEIRIPSMFLSILFKTVDEMMGRRSLIMLLRQAGLAAYVGINPPKNDAPSITVREYSILLATVYEVFGAQGAQAIFLRGGWLSAVELRRRRPARFAIGGIALKLLPTVGRMRIVLNKLAEQEADLYGASYQLEDHEDAFLFSISECPYCAEIGRRSRAQSKPIDRAVCHIPKAIVTEMMEWATGEKHLVEEVACIAMGDSACRFRVSK